MAFLTSDQHWNNLAEKNKKSLFMEESDFALINIIPGEFPQYAGDCPNVLRQVADINDISNIPNDDINKINNDKKNSALENEIVYIKKLRQELFINMIKLEILETKLYNKNTKYFNKIIKRGKTSFQLPIEIFNLNNNYRIDHSNEVLKEKNKTKNNDKFSFKKLFKLCI